MAPSLPLGDPVPQLGPLSDVPSPIGPEHPLSAYVHVPFCATRCGYCDFNTYVASELQGTSQSEYVKAVLIEIGQARRALTTGAPLQTVFFGGGTPSLLAVDDVASILERLRTSFGIAHDAEVTLEANPDSISHNQLVALRAAGVNRLSIGMQSSQPHVLAALDRTHTPNNVAKAVRVARESEFEQVSVDLIYGTPGESLADWEASVNTAVNLAPDHISAYALIVEPGTQLARRISRGELAAPDDDDQATKYEVLEALLKEAGFTWYEVSNWSRDERAMCQHNLAYWRGANWWGFGPGAHSFVNNVRWWNLKHPRAYIDGLTSGSTPAAAREILDPPTRHLEDVMLQVRLREGLPMSKLSATEVASGTKLVAEGLLDSSSWSQERLVLTDEGRLLADLVVRRLTS